MYSLISSEHCKSCPAFGDSIFRDLSDDLMEELVRGKEFHTFSEGEMLINAGTPCTGIVCLRDGSIAVTVTRDQETSTLYLGSPGEAFGIRDWQVSPHHIRDVVAVTSGSYCYIPCELISALCASSPDLNLAVLKQLCSRINAVQRSDSEHEDPVG